MPCEYGGRGIHELAVALICYTSDCILQSTKLWAIGQISLLVILYELITPTMPLQSWLPGEDASLESCELPLACVMGSSLGPWTLIWCIKDEKWIGWGLWSQERRAMRNFETSRGYTLTHRPKPPLPAAHRMPLPSASSGGTVVDRANKLSSWM